ncbi:MAG: hypothetical protein U5Q44_02345 [Dehalococcoidia bacterium]|nr:hypothetical protein [Dehalococcoidia bacterium]
MFYVSAARWTRQRVYISLVAGFATAEEQLEPADLVPRPRSIAADGAELVTAADEHGTDGREVLVQGIRFEEGAVDIGAALEQQDFHAAFLAKIAQELGHGVVRREQDNGTAGRLDGFAAFVGDALVGKHDGVELFSLAEERTVEGHLAASREDRRDRASRGRPRDSRNCSRTGSPRRGEAPLLRSVLAPLSTQSQLTRSSRMRR